MKPRRCSPSSPWPFCPGVNRNTIVPCLGNCRRRRRSGFCCVIAMAGESGSIAKAIPSRIMRCRNSIAHTCVAASSAPLEFWRQPVRASFFLRMQNGARMSPAATVRWIPSRKRWTPRAGTLVDSRSFPFTSWAALGLADHRKTRPPIPTGRPGRLGIFS